MEEVKEGFWDKLRKSKLRQVIFFIVSMAVLVGVYLPANYRIRYHLETEEYRKQKSVVDYDILSCIEKIEKNNERYDISGWLFQFTRQFSDFRIMLQATEGEEAYLLNIERYERDDVTEYFELETKYSQCGFISSINKKKLKNDVCYEVFVVLGYEERIIENEEVTETEEYIKVSTKYYIYNGELFEYNPLVYEKPAVSDEQFRMAVQEGKVRAFDLDAGAWVYEYKKTLYWIFKQNTIAGLEDRPKIPVYLSSTSVDKLPEIQQKGSAEYREYYFSEQDLAREEDYVLYSMKLDYECPIIRVTTGIYQGSGNERKWTWTTTFQRNDMD